MPAQFEEDQRDQLTMQRLYSIILDSVHVTEAEVRDRYRIDQEKINLNYIKLPISDLTSQVKLTEDEIKKYYERNKESLKEPLKIQSNTSAIPSSNSPRPVRSATRKSRNTTKPIVTINFITPKKRKCVTFRFPSPRR